MSAFQVTRQQDLKKQIKLSAYREFLGNVNLNDSSLIKLYLVPRPKLANNSSIIFTADGDKKKAKLIEKELESQAALHQKIKKLEEAEKKKQGKKKPLTAKQQIALEKLKKKEANTLKKVEREDALLQELQELNVLETYTIKVPEEYYI